MTSAEKEKSLTEERYASTKGQPDHRESCQNSGNVQLLRTRNAIAEYERSLAAAPARSAPILEHTHLEPMVRIRIVDFPQLPRKEDGDPEQFEHSL